MPNRIEAAITRINGRLKTIPEEERAKLEKTMKTSLPDLIEYQRLQTAAYACGKLSLDEAQTLYRMYGGDLPSPEKWDKLDLATKIIGTEAAGELLKMRVCDIL